jgi:aminoglycoside 6-adenylyltransferase
MMSLIMEFARRDLRIRAALLTGSRADAEARRDLFQDYDVLYFVSDLSSFMDDQSWMSQFGELLLMQIPETQTLIASDTDFPGVHFLMLFQDGRRIDFAMYPVTARERWQPESLTRVLLDKDGQFGPLPPPSTRDYWPVPPTPQQFADACNEFWWVSTYVAKGLWRDEVLYARFTLEHPVRAMLDCMVRWCIGVRTDFSQSPGKHGKYFKHYLLAHEWELYEKTLPVASRDEIWASLFAMGALFREIGQEVAEHFHFDYPLADDERVSAYLCRVHELPPDATSFG